MKRLRAKLWAHVSELVFDCYYVANLATEQRSTLLNGLKGSAEVLVGISQKGLSGRDRGARRLYQILHYLSEMQRQLVLVNGLGVLGDKTFRSLYKRTSALLKAFSHPRVIALFDQHP